MDALATVNPSGLYYHATDLYNRPDRLLTCSGGYTHEPGALGIAVLGSIHLVNCRAHLDPPSGTNAADTAQAQRSVASALAEVNNPELMTHAQSAFTTAMQTTASIAAVLMAASAVVAWRVIPSPRSEKMEHL